MKGSDREKNSCGGREGERERERERERDRERERERERERRAEAENVTRKEINSQCKVTIYVTSDNL